MNEEVFRTIELPSYIAGKAIRTDRWLDVHYPWDNSLTGRVAIVGGEHLDQAINAAIEGQRELLTRYQRHDILRKAAVLLSEHREELAQLIC